MAAADGTVPVGVDKAAGRCGLASWLFCLLLRAGAPCLADECDGGGSKGERVGCSNGERVGRMGEVFMDGCGLFDPFEGRMCGVCRFTEGCLRSEGPVDVHEA